jgi:hypothetical protein
MGDRDEDKDQLVCIIQRPGCGVASEPALCKKCTEAHPRTAIDLSISHPPFPRPATRTTYSLDHNDIVPNNIARSRCRNLEPTQQDRCSCCLPEVFDPGRCYRPVLQPGMGWPTQNCDLSERACCRTLATTKCRGSAPAAAVRRTVK